MNERKSVVDEMEVGVMGRDDGTYYKSIIAGDEKAARRINKAELEAFRSRNRNQGLDGIQPYGLRKLCDISTSTFYSSQTPETGEVLFTNDEKRSVGHRANGCSLDCRLIESTSASWCCPVYGIAAIECWAALLAYELHYSDS